MIGPELAALLAPFAKWGALVGGGIFLVWLVRFWIRQSAKDEAVDEIRLDDYKKAEVEREDFRAKLKKTRRRMRNAARRGWLRNS